MTESGALSPSLEPMRIVMDIDFLSLADLLTFRNERRARLHRTTRRCEERVLREELKSLNRQVDHRRQERKDARAIARHLHFAPAE